MSEQPYTDTYVDRDGIPLHITPPPEDDGPGAWLRLREPTVAVDADDAPELCRALLRVAARNDVRLVEPGQDYVTITYGPWHPSGLMCGDITPGQDDCEEVVLQRAVTVDYPPGGRGSVVVGMDLGDHSQHTADTAPSALELDRVTRELAEARSERDVAEAAWVHARRNRDRYYTAWQSARARAADWRQEAEIRHRTVVHECCESQTTERDERLTLDSASVIAAAHYRRGATDMRESAEPSELPTVAELTDRVDTVEDHTDRLGLRVDGLAHEYNRIVELLSTVGDLAGQVADHGGHLETQGSAISSHTRELADMALRMSELADQITAAGTAAQLAHTRLDQREPSAEVEGMSERVATLESLIRIATTTGDLRNVEDQADDRARRAEERLAAIETRLLAVEQQHTGEAEIVHAVRRRIRAEGATDE